MCYSFSFVPEEIPQAFATRLATSTLATGTRRSVGHGSGCFDVRPTGRDDVQMIRRAYRLKNTARSARGTMPDRNQNGAVSPDTLPWRESTQ
jgi:hypothetical protein